MNNRPKPNTTFKRVMSVIGLFLAIGVVMYGFLSLTNWSFNLKDWSGFSRFLMGALGIVFLIKIFDEL